MSRPYESAWCTFVRVCTLNALAPSELVRLVARDSHRHMVMGKAWRSGWVDFERYAALLGVGVTTLHSGFLDILGFPPPERQEYSVRHCAKCWQDGYHCALFDLSIVGVCPWHGIELNAPCAYCAAMMPQLVKNMNDKSGLHCPACGLRYPSAHDIIIARISVDQTDDIRRRCNALVLWKTRCDKRLASEFHTLGSLGMPENTDRTDTIAWQLGLATTLTPACTHWHWAVRPTSVQILQVDGGQGSGRHAPLADEAQQDILCKALRRNIYKRYVRRHRVCLHQLTQFAHNELPALKGNVCSVALAYLTWHMRMKQTCNIEGLRIPTYNRLPSRIEYHLIEDFGVVAGLTLLYAEFFGLWSELENRCGRENFDINLFNDVRYRFAKILVMAPAATGRLTSTSRNGRSLVAYPNPLALAASAAMRCDRRRALGESMTNAAYTEHIGRWCWSSKTGRYQRRMFHIRDEHLLPNGVAAPLLV